MNAVAATSTATATIRVPGDKSIAHRALLVAGLADGPSLLSQVPDGDDVRHTAAALAALGVGVAWLDPHTARIEPAPWRSPSVAIDCGNSGTLARLLMGALAGQGVEATLVGDASLSGRPMRRVAAPLERLLGASVVELSAAGTLPARVRGDRIARPGPLTVDTGAPSAQVKSAVLLAAREVRGEVCVTEAVATRDHTERMLAALGVPLTTTPGLIRVQAPMGWPGFALEIPGDPSSAAFIVAAAAACGRAVTVDDVALNPRRLGFCRVFDAMGARLSTSVQARRMGEDVGALALEPGGGLHGVSVPAQAVPDLIDEVPVIVGLALLARGVTAISGLAELRVKESDRLARLVELAAAFGGRATILDDTLRIEAPATATGRVAVRTDGDHRIAMTAHLLGRVLHADVDLDVPGCERTSFPGFLHVLDAALRAT